MAWTRSVGHKYAFDVLVPQCTSCSSRNVFLVDVKLDTTDPIAKTRPVWNCMSCHECFEGRSGNLEGVTACVQGDTQLHVEDDSYDSYNGKVKKFQLDDMKREMERKLENAYCDFQTMIDDAMKKKEPESELDKLRSRVLKFELVS